MGTGVTGEGPTDQRHDDGFSLVFDGEPLTSRFEILGAPEIEIELASDKPVAQLCAGFATSRPTVRRGASPTACSTSRIATAMPSPAR